jgi:hypothetical protein
MKQLFIKIGKGLKSFFGFLLPPKTPQENILQYILRQFLISDSSGNPSITVTILIYVMVLIGVVAGVEVRNAMTMVNFYDMAGHIARTAPNGFSQPFLYLIISLSIVITSWYRIKQHFGRTPSQVESGDAGGGVVSPSGIPDSSISTGGGAIGPGTITPIGTQTGIPGGSVPGQAVVDVVGDPGQDAGGNIIGNVRQAISSFFMGNRTGVLPGQNRYL